jgi:hypothetical protein
MGRRSGPCGPSIGPARDGAHARSPGSREDGAAPAREVATGTVHRAPAADTGVRHLHTAQRSLRDHAKHAYARYSEARAGHWLLLLTADRVDSLESALRSILTRRPDNHLAETGVLAEFRYHGVASRRGQGRADLQHQLLDPIVVAGPWVLRAALVYRGLRAIQAVLRRRR